MHQERQSFSTLVLLTAAHGAVDSYLGLLPVVAPGLAAYLDIPLGDLVMLMGVGALLNNLLQPVTGYVMGKKNMAWVLWFSVILSGLPVLMGFAPNFWILTVLILLGALGTGLYHPEAALAAHDAAGDKAYLGMPLFLSGGAGVYALATPLSIWITESFGFPALAWLWIPGIALGVILFFKHIDLKKRHPSMVIRPRSKRMTKVMDGTISFWPLLTVGCFFCVGSGLFLNILSSHYELLFGPSARHWSGWVLMAMGVLGALSSFMWSALARKHSYYAIALGTQIAAAALFALMAFAATPFAGFLIAIPLAVVSPAAVHPVGITLSRNAAGATQALRTSLMIGGTYGLTSIAIMAAGYLLRVGVSSSHIVLFVAGCSVVGAILSAWQLIAAPRKAKPQA